MVRSIIPLLLIAAAILLIAWLFYRWQNLNDASRTRPWAIPLYVLCTGCVAAALLALALF